MKDKQNDLEIQVQRELLKFKESRNFHPLLNILTPWIINFLKIRYQADEDSIGDVLLALSEKMEAIINNYLRNEGFPFLIWIAKVIRNNFYDSLRKETANKNKMNEDLQINTSEELGYESKEKDAVSFSFLAMLKPEERLICKLYYGFEPNFQDLKAFKQTYLQDNNEGLKKWKDFFAITTNKRISNKEKADKIKIKYHLVLQKILSGDQAEKDKRHLALEKLKKTFHKLQYNVRLIDLANLCSISIASVSNVLNRATKKIYLALKDDPRYTNFLIEEDDIPGWIIYKENQMDDISS